MRSQTAGKCGGRSHAVLHSVARTHHYVVAARRITRPPSASRVRVCVCACVVVAAAADCEEEERRAEKLGGVMRVNERVRRKIREKEYRGDIISFKFFLSMSTFLLCASLSRARAWAAWVRRHRGGTAEVAESLAGRSRHVEVHAFDESPLAVARTAGVVCRWCCRRLCRCGCSACTQTGPIHNGRRRRLQPTRRDSDQQPQADRAAATGLVPDGGVKAAAAVGVLLLQRLPLSLVRPARDSATCRSRPTPVRCTPTRTDTHTLLH